MSLLLRELGKFARLCRDGAAAAARRKRPILVSWTFEVPKVSVAESVRHLTNASGRTFVWASSWTGQRRVAVGTTLALTGHGVGRFEHVSSTWKESREGALVGGTDCPPSLVGGFAFAPHAPGVRSVPPDALMWLPAAQLIEVADSAPTLTLNAWVGSRSDCIAATVRQAEEAARAIMIGSVVGTNEQSRVTAMHEAPSALEWKLLLQDALEAIAAGTFDKLVLARKLVVSFDRPFNVPRMLASLLDQHSVGAVFGAQLGHRWFVGRTPECLLHVHGAHAHTHGLAGSAPRDPDPIRDAQLAQWLQVDAKLSSEHLIVANFIERTLQRFFHDVQIDTDDPVLRLADIQHRQTNIRAAQPKRRLDLLDLAAVLHPTPAVGGFPRERALRWLDAHEPLARGWYAAPIGWTDVHGDGELAVAIRSAMITGATALLYAGCGIVNGSDPDEEYIESSVKMRTMLKALGIPNDIAVPS